MEYLADRFKCLLLKKKMKRYFTIALIGLFPVFLFAQITIDNGDMPSNGDTIRTSTSFDIGSYDYTTTGPNFSWDFSSLISFNQQVDTFVSIQETPWIYQAVFFSFLKPGTTNSKC